MSRAETQRCIHGFQLAPPYRALQYDPGHVGTHDTSEATRRVGHPVQRPHVPGPDLLEVHEEPGLREGGAADGDGEGGDGTRRSVMSQVEIESETLKPLYIISVLRTSIRAHSTWVSFESTCTALPRCW